MRDSLSILEQARAYGNGQITEEVIDSIFGLASQSEQIALLEGITEGNLGEVLNRVKECEAHGTDLRRLTEDLIQDLKDGIIWQYTKDAAYLHALKEEHISKVSLIAFTANDIGNAFWNTIGWTKRRDLNYYDFVLNEGNIVRFNE